MAITGTGAITFTQTADTNNNVYRTDTTNNSLTWDVANLVAGTLRTVTAGVINLSDVSYDRFTDRMWFVRNDTDDILVYTRAAIYTGTPTPTLIRTFTLDSDITDAEGLDGPWWNAAASAYEYMVADEAAGTYQVYPHAISESDLLGTGDLSPTNLQELTFAAAGADNNSGAEGVAYDRFNSEIWVAGEGAQASTPRKVYKGTRPSNRTTDYAYTEPEFTVVEPWDPEVEDMMTLYGATGADADLASVAYHEPTATLLWLSQNDQRLVQTNKSGVIQGTISLSGIGMSQPEGICFVGDDVIVCGEPNEYCVLVYTP